MGELFGVSLDERISELNAKLDRSTRIQWSIGHDGTQAIAGYVLKHQVNPAVVFADLEKRRNARMG